VGEGFRLGKPGLAQKLEVAIDFEATRLKFPFRPVGFDEVAIDEHASPREHFAATSVDVGDRLLSPEVVQRPG
jgi:hypothetical protein